MLSGSGPIRKARGGVGAVRFRSDTGGGSCLPYDDTMIYIYLRLCARA